MKHHLLIYPSLFLLACLCSNAYADDVKMYDKMPTKAELLADLKPPAVLTRGNTPHFISCSAQNFKAKTVGIAIRFPVNSYVLTKDARKFADLLGDVLSADELRNCDFEIEGHTDSSGSKEHNKALSIKRANAVTSHLVNHHSISSTRLKAIGYGEEKLLSGIYSRSAKQRRVQVKNVGRFN